MKRWLAIVGCSLLGLTAGAGLAIVVGRALEEWERSHLRRDDGEHTDAQAVSRLDDIIGAESAAFEVDVRNGLEQVSPQDRRAFAEAIAAEAGRDVYLARRRELGLPVGPVGPVGPDGYGIPDDVHFDDEVDDEVDDDDGDLEGERDFPHDEP